MVCIECGLSKIIEEEPRQITVHFRTETQASSMHSREVIRLLKEEGWQEVNHVGSHKQFKHPTRPGRVTVPHPNRDIPRGTLKSIEKQAGIKFR
jgi:predicted RNA binding protein YcfA (HicA-like mRNA interferase family)